MVLDNKKATDLYDCNAVRKDRKSQKNWYGKFFINFFAKLGHLQKVFSRIFPDSEKSSVWIRKIFQISEFGHEPHPMSSKQQAWITIFYPKSM